MFGLCRSFQLSRLSPCALCIQNERFQKKAGGASAELAPVGAQLVTAADPLVANAMSFCQGSGRAPVSTVSGSGGDGKTVDVGCRTQQQSEFNQQEWYK